MFVIKFFARVLCFDILSTKLDFIIYFVSRC
jgi:hypothetical protein